MAAENSTAGAGNWKKRESFWSAMAQIAVVGAVLLGAVWTFYNKRQTRKAVVEIMADARSAALKANPNDLKKALKVVDGALQADPNAADALAFAAAIYTDLWLLHHEPGADAKAKEFLEKAKQAGSKSDDRYGTEALHLLAAGNAKGAEDFVEEQRKKGAATARLFYAQAMAMKEQGNIVLARTGFTTALDKAWKDPEYSAAWGEAILDEGVPGAADAFNKSLSTNPDFLRGRLGLALARVQRKDRLGESLTMVKDVLARDAELSPVLKARALAIQATIANIETQPDMAITVADEALKLNPDDAWALFAKASALALKKDAGAPAAFDAVIARKKSAPVFYFEGAVRLHEAGMNDPALALLTKYETFFGAVKNVTSEGKTVGFMDHDDRYYLTRGEVLESMDKLDEALVAYDKAIEAKSMHLSRAYYAKGALLLKKKEYAKAKEILQDIAVPDGSGQIAEAYMAMGDIAFNEKDWGNGAQFYAFALTRFKAQQAPREKLNGILTDVEKSLKKAGQAPVAKLWMEEAKPLIQ